MEENFFRTKNKIKEYLRTYAEQTGEFASISIVGSHAEDGKSMEKINDVDIVFILHELTPKQHKALLDKIEDFCRIESADRFGVILETRFGPFKTASDKEITFQLHCLVFDILGFKDYTAKSPLVVFDWQRFEPLYGQRIEDISQMVKLTSQDIITARGGIDYALEQIRDGINIAVRVQFDATGKVERVIDKFPQTIEQKAETCYKSVHNILLNMWKLQNNINKKPDDNELFIFAVKIFGKDIKTQIEDLKHIYKDARAGVEIEESELAQSQEVSLNLLEKMREYLESI